MLDTLAQLALIVGTGGATLWGYVRARRFVRERLRFVDAAQGPTAPWIAGSVATLAAAPVVAILPLVGLPTALIFGLGIGTGVYHGGRDVRRRLPRP